MGTIKQNGLVGIEHVVSLIEENRADERAKLNKELIAICSLANELNKRAAALISSPSTKLGIPAFVTDTPKQKRKAVAVTPEQVEKVYEVLRQLDESTIGRGMFKPSQFDKPLSPMGLRTIAAACKQLVAEGRATEHRGRYRIVENPANPPIPDEVFVGNEDEHGDVHDSD